VEFRDFFIADELNSLSYSFWTLNYLFCAYAYDWRDLDYRCHVTHMWITPFLAALAPWWRFVQCIRRYQDSSEKVHLVNAAKYSSTIVATFATGFRRIYRKWLFEHASTDPSETKIASTSTDMIWFLVSMINSCYTSIWDIKMDWGLLQTPSRNFLLRDDLVFYRWVYYVAAPVNVVLRFAWALNTAGLTLHSDVLGYITALLEAYRRLQWNLFRLENEHFNNCADYRAINEIPLPFATVTQDEEHAKPHDQEIRLPSSDEEEVESSHQLPQRSSTDIAGSKLPRRLKHQRLQRQHTWAHTINEAIPPKVKLKRQGTFYGRRDFESKHEDTKKDDGSTTASSTVNAHDEDDEDLLHEHR
ncbi:EXS family-domain-containing protein, partial [Fennellomyces sp. T-0311]